MKLTPVEVHVVSSTIETDLQVEALTDLLRTLAEFPSDLTVGQVMDVLTAAQRAGVR